jgi:hypothetical protein
MTVSLDDQAFEPPIRWRRLPANVAALRIAVQGHDTLEALRLMPHIEANLAACRAAVDGLVAAHRDVGDCVDFDLNAETRWVAAWELSGRTLGLANLLIAELRAGFTAETGGTMRALHESSNLTALVANEPDEAPLTRQWLRGRRVPQRRTAVALREAYTRMTEEARSQGLEMDHDPNVAGPIGQIYGVLSSAAHSQRPGFKELVGRDARFFVYGPHPSFRVRSDWVDYASVLIEQIVLDVSAALMPFFGRGWYPAAVVPLIDELKRVRPE